MVEQAIICDNAVVRKGAHVGRGCVVTTSLPPFPHPSPSLPLIHSQHTLPSSTHLLLQIHPHYEPFRHVLLIVFLFDLFNILYNILLNIL